MLWMLRKCALNPSSDSPHQLPAGALGAVNSTLYLTLAQLACMPSSSTARSTARPPAEHTGLPPKVLKCSRCAHHLRSRRWCRCFIQDKVGSAREGGRGCCCAKEQVAATQRTADVQSIPARAAGLARSKLPAVGHVRRMSED